MADDFALAFRRYWMIIVTVAVVVVYAGTQLQALLDADAAMRADLRLLLMRMENIEKAHGGLTR